jgi:hypothetical protein
MKEMVQLTGGQCVLIDSFTNVVFKDSLRRMFCRWGAVSCRAVLLSWCLLGVGLPAPGRGGAGRGVLSGWWQAFATLCPAVPCVNHSSACSEGDEGFLGMSSHATFEVLPSRDIKVRRQGCCRVRVHACTRPPETLAP